jgi:mono/diheme cytochrome c family protein
VRNFVWVLLLAGLSPGQTPAPRQIVLPRPGGDLRIPAYDPAAVERGQQTFQANCAFCHGSSAKGGEGGPDLIRSVLVLDDEGGRDIGALLKTGRQDEGMPRFDMTAQQVSDIAEFLHQKITDAAYRQTYHIQEILVGDAKAGEAYFNGAGGCKNCHSPTGDLKGIGSKYAVDNLQGRLVLPPRGPGGGGNASAPLPRLAVTATVTQNGKVFTGRLVRMTDFDITIKEESGAVRTFVRASETNPKIERKDPLQGHLDLLPKWQDSDIHNVTAYLVTLK